MEIFGNNSSTVNYIILAGVVIVSITFIIIFVWLVIYCVRKRKKPEDDDMRRYQQLNRRTWYQWLCCRGNKQNIVAKVASDKVETIDPSRDWRNYSFTDTKDQALESPSAWNMASIKSN